MYILFWIVIILLASWSMFSYYFENGIEKPKYLILEEKDGYEIRSYQTFLTAEVEVTGTYEQASSKGFGILASYIFGKNLKRVNLDMASQTPGNRKPESEKIAMTAPVIAMKKTNEKIKMTAPVLENLSGNDAIRIISFVMPSKYNIENLPKPTDERIKITENPGKKMAVLKFSWYATTGRVRQKKQQLLNYLKRDGLISSSEIYTARYNAPFSAPWMNRNEILIQVK